MTLDEEIKYFQSIYPEKYHEMIEAALIWLRLEEHIWKLATPINRTVYIKDLVEHVAK